LLGLYDAKGVFNNRDDDLAELSDGLEQRFDQVDIETEGCVALFHAHKGLAPRPRMVTSLPSTIPAFAPLGG